MKTSPLLEILYNDGTMGIFRNAVISWHLNGWFHKEDGPAFIADNGTTKWFRCGLLHNTKGPAVIWNNGSKDYYINGKELTFKEWGRISDPRPIACINNSKANIKPIVLILS